MEARQILEKTFYEVLMIEFQLGATRDSVELWDSLHHVKLIKKLENKLGIKFSALEAISIRTTDELYKLVESKCQK